VAGQPEPAQLLLRGEPCLPELAQCVLQRRHPRGVALAGQPREPLQQQNADARLTGGQLAPVGGEHRGGDFARIAATREAIGRERGGERLEVRLVREHRIERLQPLGGLEQQRRRVAAARPGERDLRVQQLRPRTIQLVQRA
jgi:hypothetical protein